MSRGTAANAYIKHDACLNFSRAKTILSSTIIRPDPNDPKSSRVTILLQNDFGGWIPHDIVNLFAAKTPRKWRDNMFNFYVDVYSKEKETEKNA